MSSTFFVTGGSGLVGAALLERLARIDGAHVRALVRREGAIPAEGVIEPVLVLAGLHGQIPLDGVEVVVHCAARVHVMGERGEESLAQFRHVNVEGTLNLARQAAAAGVKRLIFISSVKVNGESTPLGRPFRADDPPKPRDSYGKSKLEAEMALRALGAETGMEIVIIRPVLVYGPGVKANFASMMAWLNRSLPLPLGAIDNRRSLVALDNLVDLIVTCVDHPAAAGQVFLVSDGEDLSTTSLLQRTANALGRRARLLPIPAWLIEAGGRLLGKGAVAQRLCGSLQVDISKTRDLLGWTPPVRVDDALEQGARDFLERLRA